jgi:predicted enzyme related to lactoylglutathione lyase
MMAKVLGVGGIFWKARDRAALLEWYRTVLGMAMEDWGGVVFTPEAMAAHAGAATVFSPFSAETEYMLPSTRDFMINLVVDDLEAMLARCAEHGVSPTKPLVDDANGKFAHILDPEGTKIELWQPRPM